MTRLNIRFTLKQRLQQMTTFMKNNWHKTVFCLRKHVTRVEKSFQKITCKITKSHEADLLKDVHRSKHDSVLSKPSFPSIKYKIQL